MAGRSRRGILDTVGKSNSSRRVRAIRNVFITACDDGYARLYDVRHPLPVLTLDSGGENEGCSGVVLVHPDGIPTAYSAAQRGRRTVH
jgi:hypothetical protein